MQVGEPWLFPDQVRDTNMFFDILTLFPAMFEGVLGDSILKRAIERELISVRLDNIRDYAKDRHKSVDDYPYGGDPGMLMKPAPIAEAIRAAKERNGGLNPKVVFFTPQGERLEHGIVEDLAGEQCLILLCGRYKGIDERIREHYVDREISIGDFVLAGGELPAMVLIEAVSRLIPGVLGNEDSAPRDSFYEGLLAPPQYTRPEEFEGLSVPGVLLSGHHRRILEWQKEQAEDRTRIRRPDLWEKYKAGK